MRKRSHRFWFNILTIAIAALILAAFGVTVHAQEGDDADTPTEEAAPADDAAADEQVIAAATADDVARLSLSIDSTWVLLTGFLVFFMQTGFAMLEAGLVRQTGVVNALLENFIDAGLTALLFWAVGFGVAFGKDSGGLLGTDNFFLNKAIEIQDGAISFPTIQEANPDVAYPLTVFVFFFFQFAFAATASTITTGAMAERTDFIGDVIYTGLMAVITYPVVVHWVWGGGWLADRWFHDFAGSTVVHTVGGITALVGAIMLGPRPNREFGKFPPPHNMGLAVLGTMILWFGWYGFNPGSSLSMGNTGLVGLITLNTTLGAGAGAVVAMLFVYARTGKWDLVFTLNGSLAGLVAITAGCAFVMPWAAVIIGAVAGILVVLVVEVIEQLKIDDPVGAVSVHAVGGIWGTLAIGLLGAPELLLGDYAGKGALLTGGGIDLFIVQLTGSAATIAWIAVSSVIMFGALMLINRLRVHRVADIISIDAYEHGASAWPDVLPIPDITYNPGKSAAGD